RHIFTFRVLRNTTQARDGAPNVGKQIAQEPHQLDERVCRHPQGGFPRLMVSCKRNSLRHWCCRRPCTPPPVDTGTAVASCPHGCSSRAKRPSGREPCPIPSTARSQRGH